MGYTHIQMVLFTKDNGKMMNKVEMVKKCLQMAAVMLESMLMERWMEMENTSGQMEMLMKANSVMVYSKAMESTIGMMEDNTLVSGKIIR